MNIKNINYGATFSTKYCSELGLLPEEVLKKLVNDFNFKVIRLPIYWDDVEKQENNYNFENYSKLFKILEKKEIEVIPCIGVKVPRWPEFHLPEFYKELNQTIKEYKFYNYIDKVLTFLKDYKINTIQIENEPFYKFGEENFQITEKFVQEFVEKVKKELNCKVMITDSGENSDWKLASKYADLLGINMYSIVYDSRLKRYFPVLKGAKFYKNKTKITNKEIIVAELQAEPWGPSYLPHKLTQDEIKKSINSVQLIKNTHKAINSGFFTILFWGVEWWYYNKRYDEEFYRTAQKIVNTDFMLESIKDNKAKMYKWLAIASIITWLIFLSIVIGELVLNYQSSLGILETLQQSSFARGMFADIGILSSIFAIWIAFFTDLKSRWIFAVLALFIGSVAILPYLSLYFFDKSKYLTSNN